MRFSKIKWFLGVMGICLLYWLIDSVWSYFSFEFNLKALIFSEPRTLTDTLLLRTPPYQVASRLTLTALIIVCGLLLYKYVHKIKSSEQRLRASEDRFRSFSEQSLVGIYLVKDGVFTYVNPKYADIFGYSVQECLDNMHFKRTIHPEDLAMVSEQVRRRTAGEIQFLHYGFRGRRKDGRTVHLEVYGSTLKDHDELLATGTVLDITDRKLAEEALRKSEERYREIVEGTNNLVTEVDKEGKFTFINEASNFILGLSPEECIGRSAFEFIHPDDREETLKQFGGWLREKKSSVTFENRQVSQSGEARDMLWSINFHFDSNGEPTAIRSIARDITERRRTEEALRQSESRFRLIFESAPVGMSLLNDQRRYLDVNAKFCEITGYERQELLGRPFDDFTHPGDMEGGKERWKALLSGEAQFNQAEKRYVHKDGHLVWVLVSNTIIRDEANKPLYFVSHMIDITKSKKAEEALRSSEEMLKVAQQVAHIGHWELDIPSSKLAWSDEVYRIFGLSPQSFEATLEAFLDRIHPEDREAVQSAYHASERKEMQYSIDHRIVRPNGEIRFVHEQGRTEYNDAGEAISSIGTIQDITERKNSEEALRKSEAHLSAIFRAAPIGISIMNGRDFTYVNKRYTEMVGYSEEELVGNSSKMLLIDEQEFDRVGRELARQISEFGFGSEETLIVHKDGHPINILVNSAYLNPDDTNGPRSSIVLDITERKKAENELKQYQEKLERMVKERTEELSKTVLELERRNAVSQILSSLGDLLQACEAEHESIAIISSLCGQLFPRHSGFLGLYDDGTDVVQRVAMFGDYQGSDRDFGLGDCWALRRGSQHRVVDPASSPVCPHNADAPQMSSLCVPIMAKGELLGLLNLQCSLEGKSVQDCALEMEGIGLLAKRVAELYALSLSNIRLRARLRHQSIRDPLTGLYNRRHMEDALRREIARSARKNSEVGILLLDVDNFKKFNDQYGHEAGDEVLRRLGGYLNDTTRAEDIACRYGGEEMLVIMPECNSEAAFCRAEDIRAGIESLSIFHNGLSLQVTASLGVATFPEQGDQVDMLVAAADSALYLAKNSGRNRVEKVQGSSFSIV